MTCWPINGTEIVHKDDFCLCAFSDEIFRWRIGPRWKYASHSHIVISRKARCEQCGEEIYQIIKDGSWVDAIEYKEKQQQVSIKNKRRYTRTVRRLTAFDHDCSDICRSPPRFPSVHLLHCDRCGRLGSKHLITNMRPVPDGCGIPDAHMCRSCYGEMLPLYELVRYKKEIIDMIESLRSAMRKAKISLNFPAPKWKTHFTCKMESADEIQDFFDQVGRPEFLHRDRGRKSNCTIDYDASPATLSRWRKSKQFKRAVR